MEKNKIYEDLEILVDNPKIIFGQTFSSETVKYFSPEFNNFHPKSNYYVVYDKENKSGYVITKRDDINNIEITGVDQDPISFSYLLTKYPELKKYLVELFAGENLYSTLKMIEYGFKINRAQLERMDGSGIISNFVFKEKNPSKSVVELKFTYQEFFDLFDLEQYDVDFCTSIFENSYHTYDIFLTYDQLWEDWADGYFHNKFNSENTKKLTEIINIVEPGSVNDKGEIVEDWRPISKIIDTLFSKSVEKMIDLFVRLANDDSTDSFKKDVRDELGDLPERYNIITSKPLKEYVVTVKSLISLYENYSQNNYECSIIDLLTKIFVNDLNVGPFEENRFEYSDFTQKSEDSFQELVSNELDEIKEKIYDSELFQNINEYREILEVTKKYQYTKPYKLPSDTTVTFYVIGVEPATNKIIVKTNLFDNSRTKYFSTKLTLEEFNKFLYQPEIKF
jgi:hypothetical protein